MIGLAILATIVLGVIGAFAGGIIDFPNMGVIVAIAVMGGFIMAEIRDRDKD